MERPLASLTEGCGLAVLDLSSGRFTLSEPRAAALTEELYRIRPAELLVPEDMQLPSGLDAGITVRRLPPWHFDAQTGERLLLAHYAVQSLEGFGCVGRHRAVAAAGALLQYARSTQGDSSLAHLRPPRIEHCEDALLLDETARRTLELDTSLSGDPGASLFGVLNTTRTPMGTRLLRRLLHRPTRDRALLQERQTAIAEFLEEGDGYRRVRRLLGGIGDLERLLGRLALGTSRPRDLVQLRRALENLPVIRETLGEPRATLLQELRGPIRPFPELLDRLQRAVVDAPPAQLRDGGVLRKGYDEELDALRRHGQEGSTDLEALAAQERRRTGISGLRVGYNRINGYYIEIGKRLQDQAPPDYRYLQALKSSVRYSTSELKRLEQQVLGAREKALALEKRLYEALLRTCTEALPALQTAAASCAMLDVLCCLAERAETLRFCRPELSEQDGLDIRGGRHPVVCELLEHPFTPNDLQLGDPTRLMLITGPNMGGKSTYMRQTALIVILAHLGSYVPAQQARIGPVDRIYTRIGAADDLAGGRSTFMVEMTEMAAILHNATAQSLVLMDEIGRGTGTLDGLALAWAAASHLADRIGSLTLFATHYFELTRLAEALDSACNVHLEAAEHGNRIVFLYQVKPGPANRSYGLQVARLAGVPEAVVRHAREELQTLETRMAQAGDLPPEAPEPSPPPARPSSPLIDFLHTLDPDQMSPREALETMYRIFEQIDIK